MTTQSTRPTGTLEIRNGRPVVLLGGQPLSQAMYSDPVVDIDPIPHSTPEEWLARCREFRDSGVHTYTLQATHWVDHEFGTHRFWKSDGVYPACAPDDDTYCVDRQAAALIAMDPAAKFFLRLGDGVPPAWLRENPDQVQTSSTGEKINQPSLASEKALADIKTFLEHFMRYCEAQPWSDRVFGYMYFPICEGGTLSSCLGEMFDHAPVMIARFRAWVREQYADDTALQAAWSDPAATLDGVTVPSMDEWRAARGTVEHWPEGHELRRFRDYFTLQRALFLHWLRFTIRTMRALQAERPTLLGMDMCKVSMFGWQINLAFAGSGPGADFPEMQTISGSIDIGELLDEPGLDVLITPADYTARTVGYGWEPEGIPDSLRLRGKTIFTENDARTFVDAREGHTQGTFRTPAEVRAGILRNAAWSLTRGHIDYWMIAGGQYFHGAPVHEHGIRPAVRLLDAAPNWPHRETEHAVAMIVDDSSPWCEDGTSGYQNLACLWQRTIGLAHCGIPYRVYLFSDLVNDNMPDYRCYLFPNLFKLDAERLALLRRKVFRDGRMAIFGPATGITDGTALGATWASRVLGIDMELVRQRAPRRVILQGRHPLVQALPAAMIYGDSLPYGPILAPAEGAITAEETAGWATLYWGINRPGLFVLNHGTHQVAWSAAVPLPGNLLRELARAGGCHVWNEEDDVTLASDTVVAVHAVKAGPRTLRFPTPRTVWDLLSEEKVGDALTEVTLDITPPETRLWYFGDDAPFA